MAIWKPIIRAEAERLTPQLRVADYTQAIMDLGATLCTRSRPDCSACPVAGDCRARQLHAVADYPGRKARKAKPLRETTMVLAVSGHTLYLERRPASGIWGGLWSLPEVADGDVDAWCRRVLGCPVDRRESLPTLRHSFSHYDLDIHPVLVRPGTASRKVADTGSATWSRVDAEPPGGMAAPVRKLIDSLKA